MHITIDQAVEMFARYYHARLGKHASQKARARANSLQKRGDAEGQSIWNRVADRIENHKPKQKRPH